MVQDEWTPQLWHSMGYTPPVVCGVHPCSVRYGPPVVCGVGLCDNRNNIITIFHIFHNIFTNIITIFDIIVISVKLQNGIIILHTYVGAVFFTASLWLGRYMGKSKGTSI